MSSYSSSIALRIDTLSALDKLFFMRLCPLAAQVKYVALAFLWLSGVFILTGLNGMQITGYSSTVHDRFAAGYPVAPVPNSSPSFIGLNLDWSGVGWNPADARKSYGFITPYHYLVARHFGGSAHVTTFGQDGVLRSQQQTSVQDTEYGLVFSGETLGDLSLGTLAAPMNRMARYPILDLNNSSTGNNPTHYHSLNLLIYGRGPTAGSSPRIAATSLLDTALSGRNQSFRTTRTDVQLEVFDSGSPAFVKWTNPNGEAELALVGNHAAISDTHNFHNFIGTREVINRLNEMIVHKGHALWVVGNPSHTWVGASSNLIQRNSAWGISGNPNASGATSDRFVLFDSASADNLTVDVNTDYHLRGLYFRQPTGAPAAGFTFSGASTLTVGRGGIANYTDAQQQFTANLTLGDHQYWRIGPGGLTIGNLNTNGYLLELKSDGLTEFNGTLSGTGGLALTSGHAVLGATASYSGNTWIHGGHLVINGDIRSSPQVILGEGASLSGHGKVALISGSGTVGTDVSGQATILQADAVAPSSGLDFAFVIGAAGDPLFANAPAGINSLLRLTAATPFSSALTSQNSIRFYLNVTELSNGQTFRAGFFTDSQLDLLDWISEATMQFYIADATGPHAYAGQFYRLLDGSPQLALSSQTVIATFADETVEGSILQLSVVSSALTYHDWALTAFPPEVPNEARGPEQDANGNGIVNLLAYAFNLHPMANTTVGQPTTVTVADNDTAGLVQLRYRRNLLAQDLNFFVEFTHDLENWAVVAIEPTVLNADIDGDGSTELLQVALPLTIGVPTLLRLGVSLQGQNDL